MKKIFTLLCMIGLSACTSIERGNSADWPSQYAEKTRDFGELHVDQFTSAPQRAHVKAHFVAAPEQVFARIGDHRNLRDWINEIDHLVEVDHSQSITPGRSNVGTTRVCDFAGMKLTERMQFWEPGVSYAYTILDGEDAVATQHLGVFTIEEDGGGGSILSWRQYFEPKPWSLKGHMMPFIMPGIMERALDNLTEDLGGSVL